MKVNRCVGRAAIGALALGVAACTPRPEAALVEHRATLDEYCVDCHNDTEKIASISFEAVDLARVGEHREVWEKAIRKLRAGMMPPPGETRPDFATTQAFASALEAAVDGAATSDPGRRSFQRLSRAEYARSVRDLLGIDVDVTVLLPPDTLSAGFDNIADAQAFSPAVMEGYLRAANRVVVEALGDPRADATSATYVIPSTASQLRRVPGAPFGTRGGISVVHNFPADGEYIVRLRFQAATNGGLIGRRAPGEQVEVSIDGARAALLDIDPDMSESRPGGLDLTTPPLNIFAGARRLTAAFIDKHSGLVDDHVAPIEYTLADAIGAPQLFQLPHLQELNITGPFRATGVSSTVARSRVFTCRPVSANEQLPCATEIIARFAERAYRRPITPVDLEGLLGFFARDLTVGDFESGIRAALGAILASPHFLFRTEQRPSDVGAGEDYSLDSFALASRLSYFLWGSIPDEELAARARRDRLRDPAELERQARRMLKDPRAESLATRFAAQWLRLAELDPIVPDALLYPNYDRTLGQAMRRETELLFDNVVREDTSVLDLLTADYTFVNERLAAHYGIPGVLGERFRRVAVTDDNRRGLLGHGSFLTMTSHADRTSPVLRGKWVLEVLLGTPPPPPPANVPKLEETAAMHEGELLTVRERLEAHRADVACRSCHQMIDPIGLALENFDPTGAWRRNDAGAGIDARALLFDGTAAEGPAALRAALLKYSDAYLRTFTENLLTYALGRRVEYYDMPVVREVVREAALEDYHFSEFVVRIVTSEPFMRARAELASTER